MNKMEKWEATESEQTVELANESVDVDFPANGELSKGLEPVVNTTKDELSKALEPTVTSARDGLSKTLEPTVTSARDGLSKTLEPTVTSARVEKFQSCEVDTDSKNCVAIPDSQSPPPPPPPPLKRMVREGDL